MEDFELKENVVDLPNDLPDLERSETHLAVPKEQAAKGGCREACSGAILEAVWYNVVVILALLAWAALILLELFVIGETPIETYVGYGLHVYFVFELLLRICIYNWPDEYRAGNVKWYSLDALLLIAAIAVEVSTAFPGTLPVSANLIVQLSVSFARIVVRIYIGYIGLLKGARRLVGGRKRRFIGGGFDLDLTYIEPQVIAMGLPSVKYEGLYRNPLKQVTKFFNTRHPEKYRIYNLCEERDYPEDGFHGRVRRFGFDDHNPPPLSLLVRLCNEASEFLTEDKKNVVAIHCKGGKGRTGVVTASILLKLHKDYYAEKALTRFAVMRTEDDVSQAKRVGVDGPSQRRYVEYWEKIRDLDAKITMEKLSHLGERCKFKRLNLYNINVSHRWLAARSKGVQDPKSDNSLLGWTLMVSNYWYNPKLGREDKKSYTFSAEAVGSGFDLRRDGVSFNIKSWEKKSSTLRLTGDVRFQVYPVNIYDHPGAKAFCEFWVHTAFLFKSGQFLLRKSDLDGVFRDPKIDNEFNIQLTYTSPPGKNWADLL